MVTEVVDPVLYVGGIGEAVWRSKDQGKTFQRIRNGMYIEMSIRSLCHHPTEPLVLFAGTDAGVFRTDDGGENWWRAEGTPLNDLQAWSIAISPHDPELMYAGTCPGAIFRSHNGGRSWQRLAVEILQICGPDSDLPTRVLSIVFHPTNPDIVFAGTEIDGVRRTMDGGETWETLNDGLTSLDVHGLAISSQNPDVIFAATNVDTFRSDNGGAKWVPLELPKKLPWGYSRAIKITPHDGSLYVGVGSGPPGHSGGLYRSADLGDTWEQADLSVDPNSTLWAIATNLSDPNLLFATSCFGQLFLSKDSGDSWSKLDWEFGEVRSLAWVPG